jgi:uncharacterized protein YegL
MKKGITEIVYILDRSGSMEGLESDTIGGFNAMLEKQKKTETEALVSTVLFDDRCQVIYDRVPISKVPQLTEEQYYVRGCTALLDAIGGAIHHIGNVHKYAREEDVPEKTIFVITTDGMENASRSYSYDEVREMIAKEQEKYGWEFIFIGANIDSFAEARKFGIRKERVANYVADGIGTAKVYTGVAEAVCCVMEAPSLSKAREAMDKGTWAEDINKDYERRGRRKEGRK